MSNATSKTISFGSSVYRASNGLLDLLKAEYKTNDKRHGWALAVLGQGFRMPEETARELLDGTITCQIRDYSFEIQTD